MLATATRIELALATLGIATSNKNNPICLAMPKVDKASKQGLSLSPALSTNFYQWKHGL